MIHSKISARVALSVVFLATAASASLLNDPNACAPALVTPCMAAAMSGPVQITDPSQIAYQIWNVNGQYVGEISAGNGAQAFYLEASGLSLPADPTAFVAQAAAAVAALPPGAPLAPNPGGAVVATNSTTSQFSGVFIDTPFTQRVDDYQTTIEATLNGGASVFQETFSLPFSDPSVQNAIAQADAILAGDSAAFGSPSLISNTTALLNSQTDYVVTGQTPNGANLSATYSTFGPASIAVGVNMSELFTILAGQLDININTEQFYDTDRNVTTTNTFDTSQTYLINGTTTQSGAVPEPAAWLLSAAGLLACLQLTHVAKNR